jgi:hypothetical protein
MMIASPEADIRVLAEKLEEGHTVVFTQGATRHTVELIRRTRVGRKTELAKVGLTIDHLLDLVELGLIKRDLTMNGAKSRIIVFKWSGKEYVHKEKVCE